MAVLAAAAVFGLGVLFGKGTYAPVIEAFLEMMNHKDEDIRKEARSVARKYKLIGGKDDEDKV